MIRFNERFSFEREPNCWILYEHKKGKSKKTKEEIDTTSETYHANLDQVCRSIIDKTAGEAKDVKELRAFVKETAKKLGELISKKGVLNG